MPVETIAGGKVRASTRLDDVILRKWNAASRPTTPVLARLGGRGAETVGDLAALTETEVREIPGVGPTTFEVLDKAREAAGLTWASEGAENEPPPAGVLIRLEGEIAEALIRAGETLELEAATILRSALERDESREVVANAIAEAFAARIEELEAEWKDRVEELRGRARSIAGGVS